MLALLEKTYSSFIKQDFKNRIIITKRAIFTEKEKLEAKNIVFSCSFSSN